MRQKRLILGFLAVIASGPNLGAVDVKWNDWVESVKVSGDLRLRQENFDKTTEGQIDRSRQRFRLRLASDWTLPHRLSLKLRFASGAGEQVSTNQSLDNLSSQKEIWIDRAMLSWIPGDSFRLSGGKMENPIWRIYSSDIVWDDDFNPEGFSQQADVFLGSTRLFANALQMIVDEDSATNEDQWLMAGQLGGEWLLFDQSRWRVAGALYEWINERGGTFGQAVTNEGNRRSGSTLSNEFQVAELTTEYVTWIFNAPLSLQGTYIKNRKAMLDPKEDSGYQAGLILGKAQEDQTWEAAYFYKRSAADATVADVADSDFGDGGTNRQGHIVWAAYNPSRSLQVKAKYFSTRVIDENLSPGEDDINRFQFDLSVKF